MVAFVLYSHESEAEVRFSQSQVIIGSASAVASQLGLSSERLEPEHLVFTTKQDQVFLQNRANDPFVTLNAKPFGRKRVKNGDQLQVHQFLFTIYLYDSDKDSPAFEDPEVEALIREVEGFAQPDSAQNLAKEEGVKRPPKEASSTPIRNPHHFTIIESSQGANTIGAKIGRETLQNSLRDEPNTADKTPLRQRDPRILEEEKRPLLKNHFAPPEPPSKPTVWRPLFAILIILLAICTAIVSGVYFTFSEQSDGDEYLAAQALADTSMATLYAQLNQMKPPNQNWGEPSFIQNGLEHVLSQAYSPITTMDSHGVFESVPYMLRIYSNGDMSQFLLIAQPEPSLWQWLLSRETVIIDSRTMELRKATDLRELNRLVASEKPLEGANALEVSHWIATTDPIRLSKVASEMGHREFNPPQNLAQEHPGAERRVYNVPRYHPLTSQLTDRLAQLTEEELLDDTVVQPLKQQVERLRSLPDLVFFSTGSDESAQRAREILQTWTGEDTILMAVVTFDIEGSRIVASHLLPDEVAEEPDTEPGLFLSEPEEPLVALAEAQEAEHGLHPVVLSLQHAIDQRREELLPLAKKIRHLLRRQQKAPLPHFVAKLNQLLDQWETVELGQEVDIRQAIVEAYRIHVLENQDVTLDEFVQLARLAQAETFLPSEFLNQDPNEVSGFFDPDEED